MSVEWHLLSAEFANHPLVAEGAAKPIAFSPPRMAGMDCPNRYVGR
jgi:hypothetical protein